MTSNENPTPDEVGTEGKDAAQVPTSGSLSPSAGTEIYVGRCPRGGCLLAMSIIPDTQTTEDGLPMSQLSYSLQRSVAEQLADWVMRGMVVSRENMKAANADPNRFQCVHGEREKNWACMHNIAGKAEVQIVLSSEGSSETTTECERCSNREYPDDPNIPDLLTDREEAILRSRLEPGLPYDDADYRQLMRDWDLC